MAKVKSSGLRNYVGRLGGSVYYILKGQNIARELAPQISNPRTSVQMRQRMKWANLVAMYKASKGWMGRKSFEGKKSNWSDYNAFMSANLGADYVYLTKQMVENGHCVLAPYTMTKGSLPSIAMRWSAEDYEFASDISLGGRVLGITSPIKDLSEAIVDNNAGWAYGDQLSIIVMFNGRTYRPYLYAFEIILDSSDETTLEDIFNANGQVLYETDGNLHLNFNDLYNPTQGLAVACTFVHSRTTSGKTSVSTQQLALNADGLTEYNALRTEDAFNNARESYGIGVEVFLDAGYIDGTRQSEEMPNGIVSFTGVYATGEDMTDDFAISNGGVNTFKASSEGGTPEYTTFTIGTLLPMDTTKEYCLAFLPAGESTPVVSNASYPSGPLTLQSLYPRTGALQIEGKAGTFYLVESDIYERDKRIAACPVTA